jgi:hypothetical protein
MQTKHWNSTQCPFYGNPKASSDAGSIDRSAVQLCAASRISEDFSDLAELRLLRLLRRAYLFCLFNHPMLSECCRRQHFSGLESFDASMEDVPIELIWLLENLVGLLDPRSFTAQNAAF